MTGAPTTISRELIEWADVIFAMEKNHKEVMTRISPNAEKKIVVLNIPDRYRKNDPKLIKILKQKLSRWFESILNTDFIP